LVLANIIVMVLLTLTVIIVAGVALRVRTTVKMEQELKANAFARKLFETAPVYIEIWDDKGGLLECNKRMLDIFGVSGMEEYKSRSSEFIPELQPCGAPSLEMGAENLAKALSEGSAQFEWMRVKPGGEPLPMEVNLERTKRDGKTIIVGYSHDLRPVKEAMEKERSASELAKMLLDSAPFVVGIWDDGYEVTAASQQAREMFGISDAQELAGEGLYLFSPELQPCGAPSREKARQCIAEAYRSGVVRFEWMHKTASGEPLPTEIIAKRFTRDGKDMVVSYTTDVRPIKAALERERAAQEMSEVFNVSPFVVSLWDETCSMIYASQQAVKMFGLSSKEQYIERFYDLSPKRQPCGTPSREKAADCLREAFSKGHAQLEWMHQTLSGEPLPAEVTLARFAQRGKQMVASYTVDLRPTVASMRRELEAEERARLLFDVAPMSLCLLDANYKAVGCNQAAVDLFMKEPGKSLAQTFPGEKSLEKCVFLDCEEECGHYRRSICFARKYLVKNYRRTFRNYEQDKEQIERSIAERCVEALRSGICTDVISAETLYGEVIPCEVTIVPVRSHDTHSFAVYRRDMRDERRREIAERENQSKSKFLAHISHEIRTPMNAIVGMAELAMRADSLDAACEYSHTVKQAGTHLLSIINDILDISKAEKGKLEIVPTNYHFSTLLNDVIGIIRMKIADSRIRFAVNVDSRIPNSLHGDEVRVRQVLLNLLTNAVKYNDSHGFVHLRIHGEMDGESSVKLTAEIEDSGQGIEEDNIKTLFDEYSQFDLEKNKGTEGTGLGLAITRHLVEAMGGQISVRSTYGKGSTFTTTFSQAIRSGKPLGQVESAGEKNILVYERRSLYAKSMMSALENLGVSSTLVFSNAGMLEMLAEGKHTHAFIPYELYVQNVNAISKLAVDTKIVLLTKFGEALSDRNLVALATPAHSLSVASVLNGGRGDFAHRDDAEFAAGFTAPEASILVVDDVLTNLKVVKGLLLPYEMQTSLCTSGEMALSAIKLSHYDIVFMDHLMPGMDGVETMTQIRKLGEQNEYFAQVPIVILTANVVSGMREYFMESGFSDFLSKPLDVVKLNTILEKWVPKEKQRRLHGKR